MSERQENTQDLAVEEPPPVRVEESWEDEPALPPRPRRRLMTPLTGSLLGVLLLALGFIGGVIVQKGQEGGSTSGASGAGGFASRLAGLKAASRSSTGTTGAAGTGGFGAPTNATSGKVTFVQGRTLYVETTEGTSIKVQTSATSAVTKTVKGTVHSIKPGETVLVTGSKASSGAVQAESIRVGSTGAAGLFGRAATTAGSTTTGKSSSEPQLFGPGG